MATFNKFQAFVEHQAEGVHNLGGHVLKIMLVNSPAPVNTNSVKADLTEIAAGNGYTAGGAAVTVTASSQTSGTQQPTSLSPSAPTSHRNRSTACERFVY